LQTVTDGCGKAPGFQSEINQQGCFTLFENFFVGNIGLVGGKYLKLFKHGI
jgi:hypothetical protein